MKNTVYLRIAFAVLSLSMLLLLVFGCQTEETLVGDDSDNNSSGDLEMVINTDDRTTYIKKPFPITDEDSKELRITYTIDIFVKNKDGSAIDKPVEVSCQISPSTYGVRFSDNESKYSSRTNNIGRLVVGYYVKPYEAQNHVGKSVTISVSAKNAGKVTIKHSLVELPE